MLGLSLNNTRVSYRVVWKWFLHPQEHLYQVRAPPSRPHARLRQHINKAVPLLILIYFFILRSRGCIRPSIYNKFKSHHFDNLHLDGWIPDSAGLFLTLINIWAGLARSCLPTTIASKQCPLWMPNGNFQKIHSKFYT